jgi:hypothetical protein
MDNDSPEAPAVSRRAVVRGAAGIAAVGAAAVAVTRIPAAHGHETAPAAHDAAAAAATTRVTGALPKQDWAIYVRDADSGELDVFVGTQHFAVRDSDLVARLVASVK